MEKIINEEQFFHTYLKTNQIKKIHKDQILELFELKSELINYLVTLTNRLFYCIGKIHDILREIKILKRSLDKHLGTPQYEKIRTTIEKLESGFDTPSDPYFIMEMEISQILHTLGAFAYSKEAFHKCAEELEAFYGAHEDNDTYRSESYEENEEYSMEEIMQAINEALNSMGNKHEARDTLRNLRYAKFFFIQFFSLYKPHLPFHLKKKMFFSYIDKDMSYEEEVLGIDSHEGDQESFRTTVDLP